MQLRSLPVASVGGKRLGPLNKDDLPAVSVSRLRALDVIRPDMTSVAVEVGDPRDQKPGGFTVGLQHIHFPNGGGWSFFVCPQCGHRARTLRLTRDGRLACRRCDGLRYRCERIDRGDRSVTIAKLKALLYGPRQRIKPHFNLTVDRRRRLEASLRRALIRERQARLERANRE